MEQLQSLEAELKQLLNKFECDVGSFLKMNPSQQSDTLYCQIWVRTIVEDATNMEIFNISVKGKISKFYVELHEVQENAEGLCRRVELLGTFQTFVRFSDYAADMIIATCKKCNGATVGKWKIYFSGESLGQLMITRRP